MGYRGAAVGSDVTGAWEGAWDGMEVGIEVTGAAVGELEGAENVGALVG